LLAAADQEESVLTHNDIIHNIEILQEKVSGLIDKASLLHDKMFCCQ
jgi:hypothetical protein